jgi:hypothetical protein
VDNAAEFEAGKTVELSARINHCLRGFFKCRHLGPTWVAANFSGNANSASRPTAVVSRTNRTLLAPVSLVIAESTRHYCTVSVTVA